ncbi:unnamed protein product [Peniophora sp. CBMAI 1063]|nr:unnamed protein product [Peniophora sp. CBMAI 1063]
MPSGICDSFQQITDSFLRAGAKRARVSIPTLQQSVANGGINFLNIRLRNMAIAAMTLKSHLLPAPLRPVWSFVLDTILPLHASSADSSVAKKARTHLFLQTWSVPTARSSLPRDIADMLKVARNWDVHIQALLPQSELRLAMPAWYHLGAAKPRRARYTSDEAKCLRKRHRVRTIQDLLAVTERLHANMPNRPRGHANNRRCRCPFCDRDRAAPTNCENPNACTKAALIVLRELTTTKWNPAPARKPDDTEYAPLPVVIPDTAPQRFYFNPSVLSPPDPGQNFRIFSSQDTPLPIASARPRVPLPPTFNNVHIILSSSHNALDVREVRCAIRYPQNPPLLPPATNPTRLAFLDHPVVRSEAEGILYCILFALQSLPADADITFHIPHINIISILSSKISYYEDRDWSIPSMSRDLWITVVSHLRSRPSTIAFAPSTPMPLFVKNLPITSFDAVLRRNDPLPFAPIPGFVLTGRPLHLATQSSLYRVMRDSLSTRARRATDIHTAITRHAVFAHNGSFPEPRQVWKSLRHKDSSRKIHDFLFHCMHNAYYVGAYWDNIPNYTHLGICTKCGVTDSLEHILCECDSPGQKLIWRLAKDLLARKISNTPDPSLGTLLGLHLLIIKAKTNFSDDGAKRLFHIVYGESAQLIWAIRCRRVIDELPDYSDNEIYSTWCRRISRRLHLDQAMTHPKYGRAALPRKVVLATWSSTLTDERLLPDDWIRYKGSLVSIRFPQLRQPRRRPER